MSASRKRNIVNELMQRQSDALRPRKSLPCTLTMDMKKFDMTRPQDILSMPEDMAKQLTITNGYARVDANIYQWLRTHGTLSDYERWHTNVFVEIAQSLGIHHYKPSVRPMWARVCDGNLRHLVNWYYDGPVREIPKQFETDKKIRFLLPNFPLEPKPQRSSEIYIEHTRSDPKYLTKLSWTTHTNKKFGQFPLEEEEMIMEDEIAFGEQDLQVQLLTDNDKDGLLESTVSYIQHGYESDNEQTEKKVICQLDQIYP